MNDLMNALGYVSDSLDKPGRAVRGVLAGKGREALSAIPFSDSLGITDAKQRTSGRDLTNMYGLTDKYDHSFGSSALGFGAEMLTDPLNLAAGYGAFRAAPTIAKGLKGAAGAVSGLDLIGSLGRGAGKFLSRGAKPTASAAAGGDDLADMLRLDSPLPGSAGFVDRPGSGSNRGLRRGDSTVGVTEAGEPGSMEARAAWKLFPNAYDGSEKVRRIEGTSLTAQHQGKGLGQAAYLDMMDQHPNDWFYNSQASPQASRAADALERKGLIEHYRNPGLGERPHMGRITGAGQELLSHPDLIPSLFAGKGFPSPMPLPPRGTVNAPHLTMADLPDRAAAFRGKPETGNGLLNDLMRTGPSVGMDIGGGIPRNHPDHVNGKTFYHGTGNAGLTADRLDPSVTDIQGLFGPGIYTTDSHKIAEGYAATRGRRTGTPSIYQAKSGFNKILDLDEPANGDLFDAIHRTAKNIDPDVVATVMKAARKEGRTGADLYSALRSGVSDFSHGEEVPLSEFHDHFNMLSENLRQSGIDAFTHTGGLRTQAGQAHGPHQVVIGLDPNDFARVAPATPYRQFSLEGNPQDGRALSVEPSLINNGNDPAFMQKLTADPTRETQPWYRAAILNAQHGVETAPMSPVSWLTHKADPNAAARYLPMAHRVQLNMGLGSKTNWKGVASPSIWQDSKAMKNLMENNFLSGHLSGFSPDHMAFHELGHALHRKSIGLDAFNQLGDEFGGNYKPLIQDSVSKYAATNPAELVAEVYAGLRGNRQFDPDKHLVLRSFMKDLAGTPMLDHLSDTGIGKGIGLSALLAAYGLSSPGEATPGA